MEGYRGRSWEEEMRQKRAGRKEGSASLKRTLSKGTGEPWGGVRQRSADPGSCASDFPRVAMWRNV